MLAILSMNKIDFNAVSISPERAELLQVLIDYILNSIKDEETVKLNFICTHNSRRSQFAQVWAQYFANKYAVKVMCFSGGTEVTACNERTIAALKRAGFHIQKQSIQENPPYVVDLVSSKMELFSKQYDDAYNPASNFAAIMTCAQAEENCPFVVGAKMRISIPYEDPKISDDTENEISVYDLISNQIASEINYVFSKI